MYDNAIELMGMPDQLFHWVPDEIVVIVRLPRIPIDDTQEIIAEQVRIQLNDLLRQYGVALEVYGTYGRWRELAMPPIRRRSFLFGLHRKQPLLAVFFHTRSLNPEIDDPLTEALSQIQGRLEVLAQLGLHVLSAMPNWLMSAAPLYYTDGGTPIPPRPGPSFDVASSGNSLIGWHTSLLDSSFPLDAKGGEDALVVVLDTALYPDRIRHAATRLELRRNWLLQRLTNDLRNEDGSFVIEYDRYPLTQDVRTGRDSYGDERYYQMPDHGLSVVGLIRDIAPRAHIRLIRVLNDYGGGDIYTLFAALTDLERELVSKTIRHLVINLSLTIMPDIRRLPYLWFSSRQWTSTQLYGVMRVLTHIEEGLRLLFESLYAHGVLVVAAAGNDSIEATQQGRAARFPRSPARYDTTLGVSSLTGNYAPAAYANAANLPTANSGVAVFGGGGMSEINGQLGVPSKSGGRSDIADAVRAIYISPTFPTGEQNMSGWADVHGTSFSTAMVSGLAAHLMSQNWTASNAMARLVLGRERRSGPLFGTQPEVPRLFANAIRLQQQFGV